MPNNQGFDYNVDIAMCIDATGSMGSIINDVKKNALSFYQKFVDAMEREDKPVEQLRVKVIAFRDYGRDAEPMKESRFFVLSEEGEREEFHKFVEDIQATGGGDIPENSLEALAIAMTSDWVRTGSKRRHVIILWTDAPALDLRARRSCPNYPEDMPADFAELHELWEGQEMELKAKRLLLFAPDAEPWSDMVDWVNAIQQQSKAGQGCSDSDIDACIHLLVNSI